MDIDELESFAAVCRSGSFTQAARLRRLTQPGVSRHVQRLEQELGVRLFERGGRALTLTPAGSKLLGYAEEALARQRQFIGSIKTDGERLAGDLRIAASTTPGECLLPGLLAEFTEHHPEVRSRLFIADSAAVMEELSQQQWDLGFVGVQAGTSSLRYDVIGRDEIILAVPREHPFAARGQIATGELASQPLIEREGGSGTLRAFRKALSAAGIPLPRYRTVMVLNSAHGILSAVHSGLGLGLVSSLEFEQHGFGRVHRVRFNDVSLERDLYMVRLRTRPLSQPAAAFAAYVLSKVRTDASPPVTGVGAAG